MKDIIKSLKRNSREDDIRQEAKDSVQTLALETSISETLNNRSTSKDILSDIFYIPVYFLRNVQ